MNATPKPRGSAAGLLELTDMEVTNASAARALEQLRLDRLRDLRDVARKALREENVS